MIRILLSARLGELRWAQLDLSRMTGIRKNTVLEWYHDYAESIQTASDM